MKRTMESRDEDYDILLHYAVEHKSDKYVQKVLEQDVEINQVDSKHKSALHIAVEKKRKEVIELLLKYGANINIKEKRTGITPLHIAVKQKDTSIAKLLLDNGANVNATNRHNSTALHIALELRDEEMVQLILDHGANLSAKKFGQNLLHIAAEQKNINLAKRLIDKGIDVNELCMEVQTALHIATEEKDAEMVKLLLENGARTDLKKFGKCPLYIAVNSGCLETTKALLSVESEDKDDYKNKCSVLELAFQKKDKDMVHLLLQQGVDSNSNIADRYPLHLACEYQWEDTVKLLLSRGADVCAVNSENASPLHVALTAKNEEIAHLLLHRGADVNVQEQRHGMTPLHAAAKNKCPKTTQLLLRMKAELNTQQLRTGMTPLHLAVSSGCHDSARLLLEAGAQPDLMSNIQVTPLHLAFETRDREMIRLLLEKGANSSVLKTSKTPLEIALENHWLDIVRLLLERGADANGKDSDGQYLIATAIQQRNLEEVLLLLDHGARPNLVEPRLGLSLLQLAVNSRCDEAVEPLLSKGAQAGYVNEKGVSALQLALDRRSEQLVRILLERGAHVRLRRRTMPPLHVAADARWLEVTKILLSRGVNPNERNVYQRTPLLVALSRRDLAMTKLLLANGADPNLSCGGFAPIHSAAESRLPEAIEMLLDSGARIDERERFKHDGSSALCIALENGDQKSAMILLKRGANILLSDRKLRRTPLHIAAEVNCPIAAEELLARGATVDALDRQHVTPLQLAVSKGHRKIVALLLENGADPNTQSKCNGRETSLHRALLAKDPKILEMLLQEGGRAHTPGGEDGSPVAMAIRRVDDVSLLRVLMDYEREFVPSDVNVYEIFKPRLLARRDTQPAAPRLLVTHLVRFDIPINGLLPWPEQSELMDMCREELLRLRKRCFYEKVTYYQLLTVNYRTFSPLANNYILVHAFRTSNYHDDFPIYAQNLEDAMERVCRYNDMHDEAEEMLGLLLGGDLPHLYNQRILRMLSATDVRVLSDMCQDYRIRMKQEGGEVEETPKADRQITWCRSGSRVKILEGC